MGAGLRLGKPQGFQGPKGRFSCPDLTHSPKVVTYQSWFISWEASPNTDNWPLETGFGVNEILVLAPLISSVLADKTVAGKPD